METPFHLAIIMAGTHGTIRGTTLFTILIGAIRFGHIQDSIDIIVHGTTSITLTDTILTGTGMVTDTTIITVQENQDTTIADRVM